jgi:hypothetical protein
MKEGDVLTVELHPRRQEYTASTAAAVPVQRGDLLPDHVHGPGGGRPLLDRLTEGGEESMCGWLKDKFGVSWQVYPTSCRADHDPDPAGPSEPLRRCCRCAASTSPRSGARPTACRLTTRAGAGRPPLGSLGADAPASPRGAVARPDRCRLGRARPWSVPAPRCGCSTSAGQRHVRRPARPARARRHRRRPQRRRPGHPPPPRRHRRRRARSAASRATATCCTRSSRPRRHDGGYDLALCHYVLEVVDDPAVTLREIAGPCARRSGERRDGQPGRRRPGPRVAGHPSRRSRSSRTATPPRPRRRPGALRPRTTCSRSSRARAAPGPWRGVSVVADLLEADLGADRRPSAPSSWPSPSLALPRHRHRPARPRHPP